MKILAVCVFAVFAQLSYAQFTYTAVNIPGATETEVRGVNSSGEIVGYYKTTSSATCTEVNVQFPNCPVHGFKIVNGVLTKLMVPNSTWTAIMGVNDFGDLVGFTVTSDGSHGFLWKHTNVITLFNAPGAGPNSDIHTVAMSVNKALIVAGASWFFSNTTPNGGWVWANGAFSLMNPGDTSGSCCPNGEGVNGISNNGFVSGQNSSGAWFKSGTDEDFYMVTSGTVGTAVNSNADVIGFSGGVGYFSKHIELNENNDAVEVKPGFIKVMFPGSVNTYPFGLSDLRTVVGAYTDSAGMIHGFVAKPTF